VAAYHAVPAQENRKRKNRKARQDALARTGFILTDLWRMLPCARTPQPLWSPR